MKKHRTTYKYQRIKDLRIDNELTQKEIADLLGMYLTTYARYERGEKTIPINELKKLCKIYNTSIDYLTEIEEEIINRD